MMRSVARVASRVIQRVIQIGTDETMENDFPEAIRNLTVRDTAELTKSVKKKISEVCNVQKTKPSTALNLLMHFDWNVQLVNEAIESYTKLEPAFQYLVPDTKAPCAIIRCVFCMRITQCTILNCSHSFCDHCSRSVVEEATIASRLPVRCPILGCRKFINFPNLPDVAQRVYFTSILVDLQYKRKRSRRSLVRLLWDHKKKIAFVAATGGLIIFGIAKAKTWEENNPVKAKIIRGSIVFYQNLSSRKEYLKGVWDNGAANFNSYKGVWDNGAANVKRC